MLSDVEGLQQEPERSDLKFNDLLVAPIDGEPEIGIELLGEFGILGGHERFEISHGTQIHFGCVHERGYRPLSAFNFGFGIRS